ncbi:MAG: hypothetical protein ACON4I_01270 [Candidatus Puniceispirillaceae bacterium]
MTKLWHSCDFAFSGTAHCFRNDEPRAAAFPIHAVRLAKPAICGNHSPKVAFGLHGTMQERRQANLPGCGRFAGPFTPHLAHNLCELAKIGHFVEIHKNQINRVC